MADISKTLEEAHKKISYASGSISSQLARRKFSKEETLRCVRFLVKAVNELKPLIVTVKKRR